MSTDKVSGRCACGLFNAASFPCLKVLFTALMLRVSLALSLIWDVTGNV